MADAVTVRVTEDGPKYHVVKINNISDATGESAVVKVDASTIEGPEGPGTNPSYFAIVSCEWAIQGMTRVDILFDATSPVPALLLNPGNGYADFAGVFFNDPQATGTTGDIKLTTTGALSDGSYEITLKLIKKA